MTDEQRLFKAIRSNRSEEPEATFQYIYTKYKPLVSFVVAQLVKSNSDIEDITQDVFIAFFNNIENIHSTIKTYLTVSAKNLSINHLKRNNKIDYMDVDDMTYLRDSALTFDSRNFANNQLLELINEMKKVLAQEDVVIILLHLIDDLKFEEIAMKLNRKTKTIKTKYYRALKKYKKMKGVM